MKIYLDLKSYFFMLEQLLVQDLKGPGKIFIEIFNCHIPDVHIAKKSNFVL